MAVADWKVSDISVVWAPLAAPTLAAFGRLLPEVALVVASNLCASDIRGLLCTCRLLRCAEGLAAKRELHCTQATFDIIAAARLDSEQDDAVEYLASAELRVDPFHGEVTFDDLCHLECCGYRKTGYMPQLGVFLAKWEYLEVPEEHGVRQAERIAQQQSGLSPLTMQGGPPSTLIVFEAVAGRYCCDGVPGGKLAALPRVRGAIAERMRRARQLLDRAARSEAAPWLLDVLAMKPTHAGANYELGLLHLSGAGVAKDESYAIELLNAAAKQGHLETAFKLGCLHVGRGELLEAQRAFEEALHAEGTLPRERANAAYNLGIVHQGQGNVVESEGCFWHAREEGCLRAPYNLGALYLERGHTDKARRLLEEALRGDLVAQAACALGQYYEAHRCPKRARTYYERALAGGEPLAAACLSDMRVCT